MIIEFLAAKLPTVHTLLRAPYWLLRRVSEESGGTRLGVGVVPSGDTISMPWSSLQSGSDYCVQVSFKRQGLAGLDEKR
jgi:hypothetical protein